MKLPRPNHTYLTVQDVAAAIVAIILVIGKIYIEATNGNSDATLSTALGAAVSWLFTRSAQAAERQEHEQ